MNRPAEEDFHAFVDGLLNAAERDRMLVWLQAHPEDEVRVKQWQQQAAGLRKVFSPVLEEAVPERLLRSTRSISRFSLGRAVAVMAWLGLGAILGFGLARHQQGQGMAITLVRPAAIAHVVYSPEVRHPVEVGRDQEAHLAQWLSKRLGSKVQAPRLQSLGFELLGGRLLPGDEGGAAAQFMYQDGHGQRLTLYVRREAKSGRDTAFRYARENGLSVFYWVDGDNGYALSGELPRDEMLKVAERCYQELASQN